MKSFKYILIVVVAIISFSCQKEIPFDDDYKESRLVLNSVAQAGHPILVNVSRSKSKIDDAPIISINDANVSLFKNGNFVEKMQLQEMGNYVASTVAQAGQEYTIKANAEGFDEVEASEKLPSSNFEILSVDRKILVNENGGETYEYNLKFKHKIDVPEFMEIGFFRATNDSSQKFRQGIMCEDINCQVARKSILLSDKNLPGDVYSVNFTVYNDYLSLDSTVSEYLVYNNISESLYLYTLTTFNSTWGDSPFSEPVRVFSNVSSGMGILGGSVSDTLKLQF